TCRQWRARYCSPFAKGSFFTAWSRRRAPSTPAPSRFRSASTLHPQAVVPATHVTESSTGLAPRTGALLAYSGWWVTGAVILFLERRNPFIRAHARQAVAVFGAVSLLILVFALLAVLSL